jgi:diguanylate cyclase (GGDEF)-like protein/PAS domain S-box-containing protein
MNRTSQALVAVWGVIAACIAFLIADLASSRRLVELRVRDQAVSYVRLIEQHASAAFDRSNIALVGVIEHLSPGDMIAGDRLPEKRRKEIDALLLAHQQRTAGVVLMYLADADGKFIAQSAGAPAGGHVSDRTHFQTLKRRPRTTVAITEAILGRVTKTWGMAIGRRVDFPDGSFAGMAGANLGLGENFTDFYSSLPLGKDSAITLRDPENRLLVRHPVVEGKLGQPVATSGWIREHLLAGDTEGVVTIASNIDGIDRIFAFRRLANYPIYATIGLSLDEALTGWKSERNALAAGALLLLAAGLFITVVLRRNRRAGEALAHESFRNRMLLRNASDGICILDEKGNALDFSDAFCNMLGYSREALLGMNVAQWDMRCATEEGKEDLRRWQKSTSHPTTFESRHRRKDGSVFDVETYSIGFEVEAEPMLFMSSRDITERKRVHEQIQHQAHYDALTGIPNRSLFYDRLTQGIILAKRDRCELALLFLDMDRFKAVNDALGHEAGDELLTIAAARIRRLLRESDTVARIGGDEFTVILPRIASREDAAEVAIKIVEALAAPFHLSDPNGNTREAGVGCSVGIAIFPADAKSPDGLVAAADAAMYDAKRSGLGYRFRGAAPPCSEPR